MPESQSMNTNKFSLIVCACAYVCVSRALCYLKLERFAEAKEDCDTALKLEPNNKKAFYRRAMANKGLKVKRADPERLTAGGDMFTFTETQIAMP